MVENLNECDDLQQFSIRINDREQFFNGFVFKEKPQILNAGFNLFVVNTLSVNAPAKVGVQNKEGLHILSNFTSSQHDRLVRFTSFKSFIETQIGEHKLSKVGEAYHDFAGGGFTAVVCLAESHLSIHTWPDRRYVTFDIFLSNHLHDNSSKATAVYQSVLQFFDAEVLFENQIYR
ncbi:MAG: S-adenosylmethionine decarboxylase [Bacteroidetes bacterium]|nr:S-adenosylmethionine decarboxylase [Bacteroidota bacterium]